MVSRYHLTRHALARHAGFLVSGLCEVGHQGLFFDKEFGKYYVRARPYDPVMGRFPVRDPIGYQDGMNLYEPYGSNPLVRLDPFGEEWYDWPLAGLKGIVNVPVNVVKGCGYRKPRRGAVALK